MSIKILPNKIQIGNYSLEESSTGITFDGVAKFTNTNDTSSFQGLVSGYTSGGFSPSASDVVNIIDKFPFAADGNATDVGDLTQGRYLVAGQSSSVSGYTSGGRIRFPNIVFVNTIDKFPFASNGNATDVGDLTNNTSFVSGQSSTISGYTSGGQQSSNTIDKFPFATDANATDVGDLTRTGYGMAGQSSTVSGYNSGGFSSNTIDKFPFASNANATDVGDLTVARNRPAGQSSTVSGYTSGGSNTNTIDKFPFATDANATDVGDLTQGVYGLAGQSSTVSGYTSGGYTNVIDKFPFATNANATDVGDLTVPKSNPGGQQH